MDQRGKSKRSRSRLERPGFGCDVRSDASRRSASATFDAFAMRLRAFACSILISELPFSRSTVGMLVDNVGSIWERIGSAKALQPGLPMMQLITRYLYWSDVRIPGAPNSLRPRIP
jgi:hypothetical protein